MSSVRGGIAQAIRRKFRWSWVAAAISLAIVAAAATTLFRLFREITLGEVAAALKTQSFHGLFAAACFVVAGYVMLACYDVFALRAIGRKTVPYRVAAFASFTSYTVGHSFGATVFTSGVIRYRIYAAWGLSVFEIARIAFITGLTYCLGNAFVLGGGILYAPDAASAFDHLPAAMNRLLGLAGLAALVGYLLWLLPRPRIVGRSNWQIVLPGPRSTLVQIAIGSLDLTFVALAMYALLPAKPAIDVLDLIVIFVLAMLIGVISYVPGSLGVMEAAVFVGLPQFRREDLLASLLTFRIMYFVIPLLLAALLLGLRELRSVVADFGRPA
jgi:glycosyltransferase 2 family protein